MVVPILTHGTEIWGCSYAPEIERVQNSFCKNSLGLKISTNNCMALGECGRVPLCVTYYSKCIKYWCKILQMPIHRYPKNCYVMLKRFDDIGRINWVTKVREILFQYGFGYVWLWQDVGDRAI